jgi:hypothetical protein
VRWRKITDNYQDTFVSMESSGQVTSGTPSETFKVSGNQGDHQRITERYPGWEESQGKTTGNH